MNLSEKLAWYDSPEERKWRRGLHLVGYLVISASSILCAAIVGLYSNTSGIQYPYIAASCFYSVSVFLSGIAVYKSVSLKRWQTMSISLGFISGACILSLSAVILLVEHGVSK